MALIDAAAHRSQRPLYLGSLVRALLAKDRQHDHPVLAGKEERDTSGCSTDLETQLEESISQGPRVRHPQLDALLGQAIEMEGRGCKLHGQQVLQPRLNLRLEFN